MTKVVNKYKESYDVYIGRGSKWGNPFIIGKDGTREEVIEKHKKWLYEWIHNNKEIIISGLSNKWVIEHLGELKDKILGCFCKPLPCHGDILVELCDQLILFGEGKPYQKWVLIYKEKENENTRRSEKRN